MGALLIFAIVVIVVGIYYAVKGKLYEFANSLSLGFDVIFKAIKWFFLAIFLCGILVCFTAFLFVDSIKMKAPNLYQEYNREQASTIIPQECARVGIDKDICWFYMQSYKEALNDLFPRNEKMTLNQYEMESDSYMENEDELEAEAKKRMKRIVDRMKRDGNYEFLIAQGRIDRNICNIVSTMFSGGIHPNKFACHEVPATMKELGGELYDLRYVITQFSILEALLHGGVLFDTYSLNRW